MLIAVQILCLAFAAFFLIDALTSKEQRRRITNIAAAIILLVLVIASISRL